MSRNFDFNQGPEQRLGDNYTRYTNFDVTESNNGIFNNRDYQQSMSQNFNQQLSLSQEPSTTYTQRIEYFTVSSRDRDYTAYPKSSNFVVHLPKEYKNIHSIELIQAIIPDKNNVQSQPYLLLKIDELEDVIQSNDSHMSDSFAIIQLTTPPVADSFIAVDKRTFENCVLYFRTPKAKLSKMTINLTDYAGDIFEFGGDGTNNIAYQNLFIFKVVTLETSRDSINQRNVF
jgi:hypothetical protein